MEPWVVSTGLIFVYLLATIVLGIVANRSMGNDMEDFLLYGQDLAERYPGRFSRI